jgi:hypothetical protein
VNLSPLILANALANSVLAVSAIHLWLKIFGHEKSEIYKHPYAVHLCKLATTVTICGSVANIFAHETPPITEFVLNIGVAANYVWLSWFSGIAVDDKPKKDGLANKPTARARTKRRSTRA